MRKTTIALMAGALALAGTAAWAANDNVHHMTVRLADGTVANVTYTGDVAPKIDVVHRPMSLAEFAPRIGFVPAFGMAPGFQRIDAMIDAQMRAMQRQMNALMAVPMMNSNAPMEAAFGKTAPGAHFCAQSMSVTFDANGKQHVTRKTAGDCGGANTAVAHEAPKASTPVAHDNSI